MPCLDEAETLASCITKAQRAFRELGIDGEVVVADNGSTDGSQEIARSMGARVVAVEAKGYGSALRGGISAARGKYVIMGDSDDSYDFSSIGPFVAKLRDGVDRVMGNRFLGGIDPGAMPWKHRWIGNPVLTWMGRRFFQCQEVGDFHCGLRGLSKPAFEQLQLRTTGMEFASEMVIKACLLRMRVDEVPTVLHKDGRSRPPHLRSWRDGWRHLRFMLLFSPRWLFLYPGVITFVLGLATCLWLWGGPRHVGSLVFDVPSMLVAAFFCILGHKLVAFAVFTKLFAVAEGFHSKNTNLNRNAFKFFNLESGLASGLLLTALGLVCLAGTFWNSELAGTGPEDPYALLRQFIPPLLILTLGVQTIFTSFFLGILTLPRK
jgi:hypothetical protein